MRVGVIGCENIGGTVAVSLRVDGREALLSDRDAACFEAPGLAPGVRVDSAAELGRRAEARRRAREER